MGWPDPNWVQSHVTASFVSSFTRMQREQAPLWACKFEPCGWKDELHGLLWFKIFIQTLEP